MKPTRDYQHGPLRIEGEIHWRVWAPRRRNVRLVLLSEARHHDIPMHPEPDGWFVATTKSTGNGQRYAYQLDGGPLLPDPGSRWQPDGVHSPSALFWAKDFQWSDESWRGVKRANLVIYELHVGTFTKEGTFDAVTARLAELRDLGVTAIELMPVSQFPGNRGWGYDGVHPFAVQSSYGGPAGLLRLVDASHRHGIAIILDVVYNHLGPEGNYLGEFGPYSTRKYDTPWGDALNFDDRGHEAVRGFVLDNVQYWLRDFHADGLRLDAVHAIFDQSDTHILREIQDTADREMERSHLPIHIIAESDDNDSRLVDSIGNNGFGLAAMWNDDFHHSLHALLTRETKGYYADFGSPDHLVKALNDHFVYDGCHSIVRNKVHGTSARHLSGSHFVAFVQNHDQVGNRPLGDRISALLPPEQLRLAAGILMLSPFLPMIFMGEEYGERHPFPYFCSFFDEGLIDGVRRGRHTEFREFEWPDSIPDPQSDETFRSARLDWSWPKNSWQAGQREWYRALLLARRVFSELGTASDRIAVWHPRRKISPETEKQIADHPDTLQDDFSLSGGGRDDGVLEMICSDYQVAPTSQIAAYFNFSNQAQDLAGTFVERCNPTDWLPFLSSEWPQFGGLHLDKLSPTRIITPWRLLPHEVLVLSSPRQAAVLDAQLFPNK